MSGDEDARIAAERLARIFKEVDWIIPAYLSIGFLRMFGNALEKTSAEARPELMKFILNIIYSPEYLASLFVSRYSKVVHIRDFARQIDESIKAYFSGYKLVAITALIPVIEGVVRKIAVRNQRDVGRGTKRLNFEFDALVAREMNSPNRFEERVVMLEGLRDFIRDRFLENTRDYDGLDELNRHGILHGLFDKYGEDINFFRLITILDLLCFSISMIEGGISVLAPDPTPESSKLAELYIRLRSTASDLP